jgi:hypothetical protein
VTTITASAAAAAAMAADAMWQADLSSVLCGSQWQESSWILTVPAGRVISGVGVAVPYDGSSSSSVEGGVLGVLGSIKLAEC